MMKNNLIKYSGLLVAVLCFGRCSDDVLEVANPNQVDAQNFFQNMNDLNLALTAVYEAQTTFELYGADFLVKGPYGLAKTANQEFTSNNPWNQLYRNEVTPDNNLVGNFWRAFYRGVARANDFLANTEQFLADQELTPEEMEQANQMRGQALYLRAFDYFHLIRLWGEKGPAVGGEAQGVPLILNVAATREEMQTDRASVGAVYEQIINDLQEAEGLLPETWEGDDLARVDAFAVKALLGEVRMFQEDYPAAQQKFEEIINSEQFSLVPFEEYDAMFHGENEFSAESIFELNLATDLQEDTWQGGTGSNLALMIAPKGTGWSNVYPHDENIRRFGSDPRLRVCALEPGVDMVVQGDGSRDTLGIYVDDEGALGWSFKKYVPLDESVFSTNRNYGANIIISRLADVYLLYAEALNAQGNDVPAAEYLNKVRRRAYGLDPDAPDPTIDYIIAGTQLRDSIREERFRELFAEGHRWYDIVRWGIVEEELARYGNVRSGEIIFNEQDYYLPIPQTELDVNTAISQSEGY